VNSGQWTAPIDHQTITDHFQKEKDVKSKQIAWVQIHLWVGIAALLFIMFVVAFSGEQSIMAFLFPAWLDRLVSWIPFVHNPALPFVIIAIGGIRPLLKWLKERKEKSAVLGR
jgi:hypothetical protein